MSASAQANWKPPRRPLSLWVNWRAGANAEPVGKLRYLRRSASFWSRRPIRRALLDARLHRASAFLAFLLLLPVPVVTDGAAIRRATRRLPAHSAQQVYENVWLVEANADHELYSNGLRIEKAFTARPTQPLPFHRWAVEGGAREESKTPFGIVFHTTESDALSFDEESNRQLRRASRGTLEFVRARRSYHFVIDRFGRVFRTVPENEAAFHAGNSVWADEKNFYLNLNHSFLGIAFDGQSRNVQGRPSVTEPQIHSARMLTALLRARYKIDTANCVTHAQVSVNPQNMGIGYHTDWAAEFPFAKLGLPQNYLIPPPAMLLFGFFYDDQYADAAGDELKDAISAAETLVRQKAEATRQSIEAYRRTLRSRYKSVHDPLNALDFLDASTPKPAQAPAQGKETD
jgi:hypothetical protein